VPAPPEPAAALRVSGLVSNREIELELGTLDDILIRFK